MRRFVFLFMCAAACLMLVAAPASAGKKPAVTADEAAMLEAVGTQASQDYAWQVMLKQVYGWAPSPLDGPEFLGPWHAPTTWWNETVGGADRDHGYPDDSFTRARWIAAEMQRIGLEPGGTMSVTDPGHPEDAFLEPFHIDGWEDLGTTVKLWSDTWDGRSIPCKQAWKSTQESVEYAKAPVVFVGDGRWDDFERAGDITGMIVLFHRKDPMFYGEPTLAEAAARGAAGAIMDYPIVPGDELLKTDEIASEIPVAYVREKESNEIQAALDAGDEVVVELSVDNEVQDFPLAQNVVGVIPGDRAPEEFVYLTTHYDHWFTSAADDGAGIGSMLAIAKAITDGIGAAETPGELEIATPDRTIVFVSFDSEELGGPPDTWYDWCMGSFAHIVGQLPAPSTEPWSDEDLLPAIRAERPGKIVAMWNMDVIGVKDAVVYVETTPDVTDFIKRCARATGLFAAAPTAVYWPPSSYDDWQFYMAGVPVMQIAWWGPAYDVLYHTTGDTPEVIDPASLRANTRFNMLATWRMANAGVAPYTLSENVEVAAEGIANLLAMDAGATGPGKADISKLEDGVARYEAAIAAAYPKMTRKTLSDARMARINRILMAQAIALNPHLFDWDCSVIPGWTGLFLFDTYANDLHWMNKAIAALQSGDEAACLKALEGVTTMEWGQYVGDEAYDTMVDHIAGNDHLLWGYGFVPRLTDVHDEYMSLAGRYGGDAMSRAAVLSALTAKRDAIYDSVTTASEEAGGAFDDAASVLETM